MSLVEFSEEFGCVEVFFIYPRVVRWRVTLPSDEVLLLFPSAERPFLEYLFNFPFWFAFYYLRGWFQEIGTMLFRLLIRREERSMEHVVNVPGWGEAEFVGDVGYFGDYLERSVSPWGKLWCYATWESQVCSFEPYFCSYFEWFETGSFFNPGFLRFTLCLLGGVPGFFDLLESDLYRWNVGLSSGLVNLRGITDKEVVRGFLCRCRGPGILGVLGER